MNLKKITSPQAVLTQEEWIGASRRLLQMKPPRIYSEQWLAKFTVNGVERTQMYVTERKNQGAAVERRVRRDHLDLVGLTITYQ